MTKKGVNTKVVFENDIDSVTTASLPRIKTGEDVENVIIKTYMRLKLIIM